MAIFEMKIALAENMHPVPGLRSPVSVNLA